MAFLDQFFRTTAGGGMLGKQRAVAIGDKLRKSPGPVVRRRSGSFVLSIGNGVFFVSLSFQRYVFTPVSCSTRHEIMSAHDKLVFAINM